MHVRRWVGCQRRRSESQDASVPRCAMQASEGREERMEEGESRSVEEAESEKTVGG